MDDITSSDEDITPAHRREIKDGLPVCLRELYHAVLLDTLRNGVPVRADALAVVLGAHCSLVDEPLAFTGEHVEQLLWFGIDDYCEDEGVITPVGCHQALHAALATAAASSLLSRSADEPRELFDALDSLRAS